MEGGRVGYAWGNVVAAGSVIGGKFRIERELGRGGMGTVYAASHLTLGTPVALKFLNASYLDNAQVVERFLREARSAARLHGEHVCRVLDADREGQVPYIVMELLAGTDLAKLVRRGRLGHLAAADYVAQACVGLAEAHAANLVHRDLKPGNLFLATRSDGSSVVKVLDFGVAKSTRAQDFSLTQTSNVIGSPGYMSPEQLRSSKVVDARSDIWALGVILFELVMGRPAVSRRVDHRAGDQDHARPDAADVGRARRLRRDRRALPREGPGPAVPGCRRARHGARRDVAAAVGQRRDVARMLERSVSGGGSRASVEVTAVRALYDARGEDDATSSELAAPPDPVPVTTLAHAERRDGRGGAAADDRCRLAANDAGWSARPPAPSWSRSWWRSGSRAMATTRNPGPHHPAHVETVATPVGSGSVVVAPVASKPAPAEPNPPHIEPASGSADIAAGSAELDHGSAAVESGSVDASAKVALPPVKAPRPIHHPVVKPPAPKDVGDSRI